MLFIICCLNDDNRDADGVDVDVVDDNGAEAEPPDDDKDDDDDVIISHICVNGAIALNVCCCDCISGDTLC